MAKWAILGNQVLDTDTGAFEDPVGNPKHYRTGTIESIEYIEDFLSKEEFRGFLRGNIAKYLHRYSYKNKPVEDLQKAQWYLNRLVELEKQ